MVPIHEPAEAPPHGTLKKQPKTAKLKQKLSQKKVFAIFMDYKNLVSDLPNSAKRFSDFSWLINPILEQGIISFPFVFIPDNYTNRMEIHQLSNKHGFSPIVCTRQIHGAVMKNGDTVDAKMESLARDIILHTDVTDIVIISGDADFQGLVNFAIFNQKNVTIVSAARALSGRFFEMANTGNIKLEIV